MQKFLPSKKLVIKIVSIALILVIIYFAINQISKNSISTTNNNDPKNIANPTVVFTSVVQQDSNNNGIPDWEETLWGLDPKGNGDANKKIIDAKKATLPDQVNGKDTSADNETTLFAKELFASIMALKQNGNLSEQNVLALGSTLQANVSEKKDIPDIYTEKYLIIINSNTPNDIEKYRQNMQKAIDPFNKSAMGNELSIMANILSTGDKSQLSDLVDIGKTYQKYAESMAKVPTPSGNVKIQLDIVNSTAKTGLAIQNMSQIIDNSLIGLLGVSQYGTYIGKYNDSLKNLHTYLLNNAIIK